MKKEIRVRVRLRNRRFYRAIFENYPSVAAFCRVSGFAPNTIGALLNLTMWPLIKRGGQHGEYLKLCFDLAGFFNCLPEELFPLRLYALKKAKVEKAYSFSKLPGLLQEQLLPEPKTPELIFAQKELAVVTLSALLTLTQREAVVIKKRFGLDGEELTLEKIAVELAVCPERVRQIEAKALRKLRHFAKKHHLIEFLAT